MSFSIAHRCMRSGLLARSAVKVVGRSTTSTRSLSDKPEKNSELTSSTLLVQDGFNVQELPVIVRKIKDVMVMCKNNWVTDEKTKTPLEPNNYPLIQAEFKECIDLKNVFALLSKCTRITPNIALAAVERIFEIDSGEICTFFGEEMKEMSVSVAKGAILDKLMNVLLRTEDTQTLLNALTAVSSIVEQHKYKFIDELLIRVCDNRLNINQLCEFAHYLHTNKFDLNFSGMIDKLWTGFTELEHEIDEKNIVTVYKIVPALRASKKTLLNLLEKKIVGLWWKLKAPEMQEVMEILWQERHASYRTLEVVGRWLNTNIHSLSEDILLNIVSKMTGLEHTDGQMERALERYIKHRGINIQSPALVVGILNHCVKFRLRNSHILSGSSEFFAAKGLSIPIIFLKSFIHPFGYLMFHPTNGVSFWSMVEKVVEDRFSKLKTEDVLDIMLSCIYLEKYPLNFVDKVFNPHFLAKLNNSDSPDRLRMKLKLIDTAMSLECKQYGGPLLPKDNYAKSLNFDSRIHRLVDSIRDSLEQVAGGAENFSTQVIVPYLFANELYVVDVMLHPPGLGRSILNLKLKSDRNIGAAITIQLPEHYLTGSDELIGPQLMRKKHFRLLGLKIVTLKFTTLSKFKVHRVELEKYLVKCLKNAEPSL